MSRRRCLSVLIVAVPAALVTAPPANASICEYPMVGVGANVIFGRGFYCDGPTEVNGSHWHCEAGGVGLGGGAALSGDSASAAIGGLGVGGASCSWRCPDNSPSPAPNPPGLWKSYLIPVANACRDHMEPAGINSEPVHPDEGGPVIPPTGPPPPQQAPPDGGGVPPGVGPNIANQTAPGEPNP